MQIGHRIGRGDLLVIKIDAKIMAGLVITGDVGSSCVERSLGVSSASC